MPSKRKGTRAQARLVLDHLNQTAGRNYAPLEANLELLLARLNEGITPEQLHRVVEAKCREWLGTNMEQYLRPATLFNRTKCAQYLGQLGKEADATTQYVGTPPGSISWLNDETTDLPETR